MAKTRRLLPKLKKTNYKNKKHHYKLDDPARKRHLAINEGIKDEAKRTKRTLRQAATAKKGRLNILRIYRRNKKYKECQTLTQDMKYIDKKYKLGKTKKICKKQKRKN